MTEQLDQGGGSSFGEMLRAYRLDANLTQEALAARSGLSVDAISMLERGVRRVPRRSTFTLLAEALRLNSARREALAAAATRRAVATPSKSEPGGGIPRELPLSPGDFTGRLDELATLRELLAVGAATSMAPERRSVVIIAIDGMAGVGKSALAIHAAHQIVQAGAFPDGQLYVNLRGSTSGLPPLQPLEALGRMLRSLGLEPSAVPAELEEAAARFRSLAADRRMLVILDNVRSAEQVRPLLPGSSTCGVLMTSRQVLASLEGTRALHLDVLPTDQALELLGRIVGWERIGTELEASEHVVRWCGRLPLTIRIAGARLAARTGWPIEELARRLSDARHRLGELESGDLAVRAAFDISLVALRESADSIDRAAGEAFGPLSLPDGPDLSVPAAAHLLGCSEPAAHALLERLVDARLLEAPRADRYQLHDLVRLLARERAASHSVAQREAALARLVSFYTSTAWNTLAALRPGDRRIEIADPRWTAGGLQFADASSALAWLEAERANLLAAITQTAQATAASSAIPPELPSQLAQALFGFYDLRAYWHDWIQASEAALSTARRFQDAAGQALALNDLGIVYGSLGRNAEAIACLQESITISGQLGDRRSQAAGLSNLGIRYARLGRAEEAIACQQHSIALVEEGDNSLGRAISLINLGATYAGAYRHADAIACLREGLTICRDLGYRQGQASALNDLGSVYSRLEQHTEAVAAHRNAFVIFRQLGDRYGQADALKGLGSAYVSLGEHAEAIVHLRDSLSLFRELCAQSEQAAVLWVLADALHAVGRDQQASAARREYQAIVQDPPSA